jgi:hypothetical protein
MEDDTTHAEGRLALSQFFQRVQEENRRILDIVQRFCSVSPKLAVPNSSHLET